MRSAMLLFCSIILLAHSTFVEGCGGGSSSSTPRPCSYQVCRASYGPWSPWPSSGQCIYQYARVRHTYQTLQKSSGCPANQHCREKDVSRRLCSCPVMSHCSWGSWGPFKGSIAEGQCGTQRRHRNAQMVWNYVNKVGMCGETVAKCPKESDSQTRPWCMCPYYNCQLEAWTAWNVVAGSGACPNEERFRDFNATLLYKGAQSTCAGIGPSSCPARKREERKKTASCPALSAPANGTLVGSACDGSSSSCGSTCSVSCSADYPLQGSGYVVCRADGSWSGTLGQCIGRQVV